MATIAAPQQQQPIRDLISGDDDEVRINEGGNDPTTDHFLSMEMMQMPQQVEAEGNRDDTSIASSNLTADGIHDYPSFHDQARINESGNEATTNYVVMELMRMPPHAHAEGRDDASDASSISTVEGIHDYPGFLCVCMVILIGDMSRGVFFPSMWPLVESLGGNKVVLGYSVAAFSFGRILVNPLFGSWSHTFGYTKTLLLSCCILLLGTLLYAQVQNIGSVEFLIVAQTVLGIGSGTLGVTRAFVADVTARRNRTTYMALITAVQYGGFTVTPAFGALFNYVLGDRDYNLGFFRLNMYTAPAYFMASVVTTTIGVLLIFFKDRQRIEAAKSDGNKSKKRMAIDEAANQITCINLTVYDCCILGCMLLNIATKGSIATFETLGIAIAQEYFDMHSFRAGIIVACCGAGGVVALLNMDKLEQRFSDVHIIVGGMLIMIAGIASLTTIENKLNNPDWSYVLAMFLIYSIGYPIGHTAVIGLFSKIVGRRPQGTLLGWFASAGSLARMIFPIMSGYIANYSTMDALFFVLTGVLLVSTAFVLWARDTLTFLAS